MIDLNNIIKPTVSFSYNETYVMYTIYSRCNYIPILKPGPATAREKINALNFVVLCAAKNIDITELTNKIENWVCNI